MPDPHVVVGLYTRPVYTVATLPPVAQTQGERAWISDSNASPWTFHGQIAVGGGTLRCRVTSDGTNWRLHW
jgi:hypothetical protein